MARQKSNLPNPTGSHHVPRPGDLRATDDSHTEVTPSPGGRAVRAQWSVITSYSIHYTKLYDLLQVRVEDPLDVDPVKAHAHEHQDLVLEDTALVLIYCRRALLDVTLV